MCCVLVTCAAGEDVGFEELKLMEVSYAASVGLGNPAHFDRKDAHQCFAWWVRAMPHLAPPTEWWFLCPDIGLAIMLVDGTCGSWDGRSVRHCTGVPVGVSEGDELLSLWLGAKTDMDVCEQRRSMMSDALLARAALPEVRSRPWVVGDVVWVKWGVVGEPLAGNKWRRTTGIVRKVSGGGGITLEWPEEGRTYAMPVQEACERVALAGLVGPKPEQTGAALVGQRVRVYWPYLSAHGRGADWVFAGLVLEHEEGAHLVRYDDMQEVWEELGGPLAPHFCLDTWRPVHVRPLVT